MIDRTICICNITDGENCPLHGKATFFEKMFTPPSKVSDGDLPERIWIRWLGIITAASGPQGHAYVVEPKYASDTTEYVPASKLREAEEKFISLACLVEDQRLEICNRGDKLTTAQEEIRVIANGLAVEKGAREEACMTAESFGKEMKWLRADNTKLREALDKIRDPRKRHTEPDAYTNLCCVMNIADDALASVSEGKE